jgi:hypothetical protein
MLMIELWLVCEGEPGSVDVGVLQPVFGNVLATEIVVEPACGNSPSVVARFLETSRGGKAAFLNDRDYRPRSEAEAALSDDKAGFLWRRHSIENYLLPPPIILRAFRRLADRFIQRIGIVPSWFAALPADNLQISEVLTECALRRAAEEACRLANHRLWAALPLTVGHIQKRNPATPTASGQIGPNEWREALCQEAQRVCNAAKYTAGCPQFGSEAVAALFDRTLAEITAPLYVNGMEFLIDCHGRDLLKDFVQVLRTRGVQLSYERLRDELVLAVVEEYRENPAVFGRDDFLDLANGIRSLAELPALPPR